MSGDKSVDCGTGTRPRQNVLGYILMKLLQPLVLYRWSVQGHWALDALCFGYIQGLFALVASKDIMVWMHWAITAFKDTVSWICPRAWGLWCTGPWICQRYLCLGHMQGHSALNVLCFGCIKGLFTLDASRDTLCWMCPRGGALDALCLGSIQWYFALDVSMSSWPWMHFRTHLRFSQTLWIQGWQYCHMCFSCVIWNLLDHKSIQLWNVFLLYPVLSKFCIY